MTITLQAIESEHARIAALIEEFKRQPQATEIRIAAVTIPLAAGERLAGSILNDDGTLSHYVILLPDEAESVNWKDALAWAVEHGGELPTRREQSLLFSNTKDEFEAAWYWSGEQHEENSGWAWYQSFITGYQSGHGQRHEFRARAVRRYTPPRKV
ncbi:Lcl C-terminal domain-containing protein [Paraburkholderia caballeronis]|uniref:DUF1566 domain-containing protein n=1 Tax=Paraburkholderia caballeronis TaxID=416943 RepID=A0A1H7L0H0_9BURK|nr:DUF1566 domain-containing protein [Paraburkholderia caballeronis]PXW28221.1 hypothetical protein C7403_102113 [Paraburkholderia caballeronis]PXX03587.1 hypothetical protein C7407_102113 [Paraburkholderia caballeronis]RAK04331.1 hypothetical protein C7409_102113 [Paraburkholderia caballeronis]SED84492.1 hypothetical protein SAMN05445871_4066 [Paraburkholderia caballeronis]SEK91865.1 hypothetical protein SAMN05192542_104113 [Paraburkholderia caballeronis]